MTLEVPGTWPSPGPDAPWQVRQAPAPGAPSAAPAAAASAPPVNLLKEGQPTEFKNGQTWTLENGQPKRLK